MQEIAAWFDGDAIRLHEAGQGMVDLEVAAEQPGGQIDILAVRLGPEQRRALIAALQAVTE